MRFFLNIVCIAMLWGSSVAIARPVSYPGGWTVMQNNNTGAHGLYVHYSPTAKYSIGYKAEYWRDEKWHSHSAQLNYLAKRWNAPTSQANLYLKTGAGVAYSNFGSFDGETEPTGFVGITFDWEDRRYFSSYETRAYYARDIDKFFVQKARVGITPYIGDYGDIHTWLMLQVDHTPGKDNKITVTPLVRMFKGEYLVEAGISDDGDVLFNWTVRL